MRKKKEIIEEIPAIEEVFETPEEVFEPEPKTKIAPLSVSFNQEDLNRIVEKVNEIIQELG